jgi:alkanesulfonate monooxygenase SsuD/methylene tetrahydromethanopterin reductase-like flavin-dependent oxidoreductase (luciferase family)
LRAAEDLAVLDLISNGRLRLTVGAGYRPVEYEQFGLDIRNRPSRMEEAIEVLKLAWTGEPFEYRGQQVQILPRPAQDPRPEITLGGASPATARRAAAMCDDYAPIGDRLYEIYLEELDRLGKPHPKRKRVPMDGGPVFVHVSEDPDAAWAQIAPHALHESNGYAIWIAGARGGAYNMATDANELRESGQYQVLTPAEAVELAKTRGLLNLKPVMGGMDPELGWECLQLVADQVLPALEESAQ